MDLIRLFSGAAMYRKLSNIAAVLFTISAVGYGASTLVPPPAPPVVAEKTATAFLSGGYMQQGPLVGGMGSCHFNIGGVPGAGTYVAYEEPCDHKVFLIGGTKYNSHRQFRVILNGNGGYVIALANRYVDGTGPFTPTTGCISVPVMGTEPSSFLAGPTSIAPARHRGAAPAIRLAAM